MKQVHTALVILLQCWEMLTGNLFLSLQEEREKYIHRVRRSAFAIANRTPGNIQVPSSAGKLPQEKASRDRPALKVALIPNSAGTLTNQANSRKAEPLRSSKNRLQQAFCCFAEHAQ
jgi:hypothetical protein